MAAVANPKEDLEMTDDEHASGLVECIVTATVPNSEIVGIQTVVGTPAIGDELLCTETGRRYRILAFGLSPHPDRYAKGHDIVSLFPVDGSMAESSLRRGMHLVKK